jgi:hypothetical protein
MSAALTPAELDRLRNICARRNEFLPSLLRFQKLSPKQRHVLQEIADRVLGERQ